MQSVIELKNLNRLLTSIFILFMLCCCSSPLEQGEIHTIAEIKKHARNGQLIRSKGILTERSAKREFLVQDNEDSIEVNLAQFKKESKYLKKNTKIVFSGIYRKKLFSKPEIDVESLQIVEEFK